MKIFLVFVFAMSAVAFAVPKKGEPNYFPNCKALNKVYPKGVPKGRKAYRPALDRNKNGWACEPIPH